jgi:hypothetical protein
MFVLWNGTYISDLIPVSSSFAEEALVQQGGSMGARWIIIVCAILLHLCSARSLAGDRVVRYGDWTATFGDTYQEAATGSDSGAVLGVWCSLETESCFAYFNSGTACAEGRGVPVLLNTATGAAVLQSTCTAIGKMWVNVFDDYSSATTLMLKATRVGIAIPLDSGMFKVIRFSLAGAGDAIAAAHTVPSRAKSKSRDEIL